MRAYRFDEHAHADGYQVRRARHAFENPLQPNLERFSGTSLRSVSPLRFVLVLSLIHI